MRRWRSIKPSPKRLKTLICNVKYPNGNTLLHQLVLDNSYPNRSGSRGYLNATLMTMTDLWADALNFDGYTALHLAALKGNALMVEKLLSCPVLAVNVNAKSKDPDENSALHLAAKFRHLSVVIELLKRGADVNGKNRDKNTALHLAATVDRFNRVEDLANNGASSETTMSSDHFGLFLELLNYGADVNIENRDENTALHLVIINNFYERTLPVILMKGADLSIQNRDGNTALHLVVSRGLASAVKRLLDEEWDVNIQNRHNNTALHLAVMGRFYFIIYLLLNSGADVTIQNRNLNTALHLAVIGSCNNSVVKTLLRKGAVVNMRNRDGNTALHIAAVLNNSPVIRHLLNHGADVKLENRNDKTALQLAIDKGHPHPIQELLNGKVASQQ